MSSPLMKSPLQGCRRIGVFLPNWIGDAVMATPFLRALHNRYGDHAEIVGIARPYVVDVLTATPWLDEVKTYEKPKTWISGPLQLARQLRSWRLDAAILLTNSMRTATMAWASGARRRIGYSRYGRSWLLTDTLAALRANGEWQPESAVDYYLRIATYLDCDASDRRLKLHITPQERQLAERVWQRLGFSSEQTVVALHAAGGWGGTATAKAWPLEHFAELARRIVTQENAAVLVLCGPNEILAAREIARLAGDSRVRTLAEEQPSLGLTRGCLERCALLVSTDSGPRHIATALDVPTIGLFGATDPRWAETRHPRGMVLFNQLDCGPCAQKHCPLGHHRCMRDLGVDRVFAAVVQQLSASHKITGEILSGSRIISHPAA